MVLVAILFLSACDGGGSSRPDTSPLTPELKVVMQQVAAIRNLPPAEDVEVAPITQAQVSSTLESTLTNADEQSFAHLTMLYRLLGHLGPNEDYKGAYLAFAGGNVIGFYSPKDKALFVVTADGKTIDLSKLERQERSTIAHELTHALQDNSFDIQELFAKTTGDLDWTLALSAVIEGDAVNIEGLWTRDHAFAPVPPALSGAFAAYQAPRPKPTGNERARISAQTQSTPVSIERELRFPYTTGFEWVSIVRTQRRNEAIDGVLKGRRLTTAEVIHTDLYDANFTPEAVALPDISSQLGSGWSHQSGGAFGEFQLRNYLQLGLTALPATLAATGWRGDRYDLYTHDGESLAAIRVRFASSEDAAEFVAAQDGLFTSLGASVSADSGTVTAELPDGRTTVRTASGAEVLFVIASDRAVADRAFALLKGG